MIFLSIFTGIVSSVSGFHISLYFDISIAGTIAVVIGLIFLAVLFFSPKNGLITAVRRKKLQKIKFAVISILIHIHNHSGINKNEEYNINTIENHVNWNKNFLQKIINHIIDNNYVFIENNILKMTKKGVTYLWLLDN